MGEAEVSSIRTGDRRVSKNLFWRIIPFLGGVFLLILFSAHIFYKVSFGPDYRLLKSRTVSPGSARRRKQDGRNSSLSTKDSELLLELPKHTLAANRHSTTLALKCVPAVADFFISTYI